MNVNYLLPYSFKRIGWVLLTLGIVLGIVYFGINESPQFLDFPVIAIMRQSLLGEVVFFQIITDNIFNEIIALLLILGAIFMALSKEKKEDEFITKIRLESLLWATYVNYAILILALIFIYELAFFTILIFNIFSVLFFFVLRFHWILYQSKNSLK